MSERRRIRICWKVKPGTLLPDGQGGWDWITKEHAQRLVDEWNADDPTATYYWEEEPTPTSERADG